jgi:hypothetical protein
MKRPAVLFLFDGMLGKTAKWMRLIGVDAELFSGSDAEILERAAESGRILVTRDAGLAGKAGKIGVECVFLPQERLEEDVGKLLAAYGLEAMFPEKTRCPECNGELEERECGELEGVPEDVKGEGKRCWKCLGCGKGYWEGGHWINIKKVLEKIEEKRVLFSEKKG